MNSHALRAAIAASSDTLRSIMSPSTRTTLAQLALVALLRLLVSALVLRLGFVAISDDDYARVTIAQAFASAPRIDPSGTSWLPLPFWTTGAWMMLFGSTLRAARLASIAVGVAASCGLLLAMRASGSSPRAAFVAAVAATIMPVSALTGVATVPELPTAALGACSLLLLRRRNRTALLASALCVLPATLSRYESWPVALVVAASAWIDTRSRAADRPAIRPWQRAGISALALSGIASWLLWNRIAHGDALHFHTRVSSFWFASGHAHGEAISQLLRGYPWTALAGVPVLSTLVLGALWLVQDRRALVPWRRPMGGALFVVLALTIMEATGGAPTHHPERTLMLVWMVEWAFATDLIERTGVIERLRLGSLAAAAIVVALLGRQLVEQAGQGQADRRAEERVGAWLGAHAARDTILIDPVDYGYFAIIAAAGAPARVALSHSIDPRDGSTPSPFAHEQALRERIAQTGARWLVVREDRGQAARLVGSVQASESGWEIARVR